MTYWWRLLSSVVICSLLPGCLAMPLSRASCPANVPTEDMIASGREEAPVVILIHGWASSSRAWFRLAPLLQAGPVLTYDLRGFGKSPRGNGAADYTRHVADLVCIAQRVGPKRRVVLIGHSYGALIAQDFALAHPKRIAALVLIGAQSRSQRFALPNPTLALVKSIVDRASRDAAMRKAVPRYYRSDTLDRSTLTALLDDAGRADPDALRESLLSAAAAEPIEVTRFARAQIPVLVVNGEFDILPPAAHIALAALFPNSEGDVILGAGHTPAFEQPKLLAARINRFLRQSRADR